MKRAFTLLELLVVIAIIGMLIAILLPAVQAAREGARRMQCTNNLMQLGIAVKNYEQAHGRLPSGTINDEGPIRNVPIGNHMGWIPNLLPFIEQVPLYGMIDFSKGVYEPENRDAWLSHPPNVLGCPSDGGFVRGGWGREPVTPDRPQSVNYKANHSSTETPIDADNDGVFFLNSKLRSRDIPDGTSNTIFFGEASIFRDGRVPLQSIRYGRQQVILPEDADERFVYGSLGWMSGTPGTLRNTGNPPNVYVGPFSNWTMPGEVLLRLSAEVVAPDADNIDVTPTLPPALPPETWEEVLPGQFLVGGFGSNHPTVTNFAFGDGSVHSIPNSISLEVFRQLGSRKSSEQ